MPQMPAFANKHTGSMNVIAVLSMVQGAHAPLSPGPCKICRRSVRTMYSCTHTHYNTINVLAIIVGVELYNSRYHHRHHGPVTTLRAVPHHIGYRALDLHLLISAILYPHERASRQGMCSTQIR